MWRHAGEGQNEKGTTTTMSRGFAGAPKFSDFRRTAISSSSTTSFTNSESILDKLDVELSKKKEKHQPSDTIVGNKVTKSITKARGLGGYQNENTYEDKENEVKIVVANQNKDRHGKMENIFKKVSIVKKEVKDFTHEITTEMKEYYERSIGSEHDP
eukprot:c19111_g1_i2 orf=194-664(+)